MPEQHIDNEKIPTRLIGAIVAVGSLAFIGILTETVMTVLFPALMREFHVDTATVPVSYTHLRFVAHEFLRHIASRLGESPPFSFVEWQAVDNQLMRVLNTHGSPN